MTFSNTKSLELLGKQVSFYSNRTVVLTSDSSVIYRHKLSGTVTNIVFNLHSGPEISLNDGDFYILSELTEFQVLDDCSAPLGTITKSPSAIDDHCSSIVDAALLAL